MLLVVHWGSLRWRSTRWSCTPCSPVLAYQLMLRGSTEHPLRRLWEDIGPAVVSCLGLAAVALPASAGLTAAGVPAAIWSLAIGMVALPRTC